MIATLLFLLATAIFVLGLSEFSFTVLAPDPDQVAQYHFGSEAMLADGGWHYSNPELYGWSAFLFSALATAGIVLIGLALLRRSSRFVAAAIIALLAILVAGNEVASHRDWERRSSLQSGGSLCWSVVESLRSSGCATGAAQLQSVERTGSVIGMAIHRTSQRT